MAATSVIPGHALAREPGIRTSSWWQLICAGAAYSLSLIVQRRDKSSSQLN